MPGFLSLFKRPPSPASPRASPADPWPLSTPLFTFAKHDSWTIGHSFEGTLILGMTGSGKSSGSGQLLARSMLAAGYGGLVLTAKPDERRVWERYCREAGRLADLIVFGAEDAPWRFNFLDDEIKRPGSGAGLTENVVNLLSVVLEVAGRAAGIGGGGGGGSGRENEGYWLNAVRQLMRNAVDLLILSRGTVTVPDLYRVITSAPTSLEQLHAEAWKKSSFCGRCLVEADLTAKSPPLPRQLADFEITAEYWLSEFPALSDKTRSVIVSSFTSMIDVLNRGLLRELFGSETTLTPRAVEDGKVILIDLPVKEFGEVGLFAQVLWKYAFQRSIERRDTTSSRSPRLPRPVFLWADEAQNFATFYDMQFATTCRAARVATVYLTQNVSNFYAALGGGDKGRAEADSLFGNLCTKIFHANTDPVTNEWAATLVGKSRQFFASGNTSHQQATDFLSQAMGLRENASSSSGFSEQMDFEVSPSAFTRLRTGGPAHRMQVDGIVVQGGRRFTSTGRIWTRAAFAQ